MDSKIISTRIIKSFDLNLFSICLTTVDITLDVLKNVIEFKVIKIFLFFACFLPWEEFSKDKISPHAC